jgi:hypothetical protein
MIPPPTPNTAKLNGQEWGDAEIKRFGVAPVADRFGPHGAYVESTKNTSAERGNEGEQHDSPQINLIQDGGGGTSQCEDEGAEQQLLMPALEVGLGGTGELTRLLPV